MLENVLSGDHATVQKRVTVKTLTSVGLIALVVQAVPVPLPIIGLRAILVKDHE